MLRLIRCFAAAAALLLSSTTFAVDAVAPAKLTDNLVVNGAVEHVLTLSVDDLRTFPSQQVTEIALTRQSGADAGKLENVKGVLLRNILDKAGLVTHDHNDVKKTVIIASASDGYKVVFSWSELYNSSLGDGVLVYFEKDGKPLADDEGHIAMISGKDTRTGPRHVKWLQSIEVRKIVD
ncbi:MAG TPA: molybdopterin-dependent oxidoreductase [Burkholderiaceae bacterium]|jgi:DMSO/TMAO reductase YedYZ molybdopterin-dependent catalytic subunit|nr:molybdopterin-dependent oxidoreductase [Burkholderiaceae bacterium]